MSTEQIFNKYYPAGSLARKYLLQHSLKVTEAALKIAVHNPHLQVDTEQLELAAMLHDIGILYTNSPDIGCFGEYPYIAHGYLGRELLEREGLDDIAPVCERHIGVGISLLDIIQNEMPLPHREMMPVTMIEKIVCYADKFYSKSESHLTIPKPMAKIRKKILKYGSDKLKVFDGFADMFGYDYLYDHP